MELELDEDYDLTSIRNTIEGFSKFNQVEALRILKSHADIVLNENKNGIYVNLSEVNSSAIQQLSTFIKYVVQQEASLNAIEAQKEEFKNTYFSSKND
jgi:hypothetical protein